MQLMPSFSQCRRPSRRRRMQEIATRAGVRFRLVSRCGRRYACMLRGDAREGSCLGTDCLPRRRMLGLLDSSSSCKVFPRGCRMLRAHISAGIGGVEPCGRKVLGRRWKTRSSSSWVVSRERQFVPCGANALSARAAHHCHERNIPCTRHRVVSSPLPLRTSLPSVIWLTYSVPRAWNRRGRRGRMTGVRRDVFVVGVDDRSLMEVVDRLWCGMRGA
jgi:hypothetical protein